MEERMRADLPAERGLAAYFAGPRYVVAERAVGGSAERVLATLDHWMESGELLVVKRRFADQVTWEPRRGTMASLKRSFRLGGRDYFLARAREVGGQVSAIGPDRVYVRLTADVGNTRREHLGGAATLAGGGAGVSGLLVLLGFAAPVALLAFPIASLGAVAVARSHRRDAERVQVALEQVLDRIEHGEIALPSAPRRSGPPALEWIADEIRRTLRP
jgi:hypothetical protein